MSNNKDNIIKFVQPVKARELPEEAYTPAGVGQSLVTFFQQEKLSRNEGLDVLGDILHFFKDDDECKHPLQTSDYITSFTNHGATPDEVIEGVTWVLAQIPDADKALQALIDAQEEDSPDDTTIH